jgi:hypothetical protein
MKTFTIAAVALAATFGPLTGQAQRSERVVRERTVVRQQIEELEARYRRMIAELPRHETDREYLRELREIEETLQRAQLERRGADVREQPRIEAEMRALERAIQEHEIRAVEAERVRHVEEAVRGADAHQRQLHERAQFEELERALREHQDVRTNQRVEQRVHVEEIERALREAQTAHDWQRGQEPAQVEEMERALRATEEHALQRGQFDRIRSAEVERALGQSADALARQRIEMDAMIDRMRERELYEDVDIEGELDRLYRDGPRASWASQDPADSLWRAARDRINRRDYENASRCSPGSTLRSATAAPPTGPMRSTGTRSHSIGSERATPCANRSSCSAG